MKWLLIVITWSNVTAYDFSADRHEVKNEIQCQQEGRQRAIEYMQKLPQIYHVEWVCVEKEY